MQVKVDKFGRMVLPKEIRDDFNIVPGSVLNIEGLPEAIVLRPIVDEEPVLIKEGVLVYTGRATGSLKDAVEKARAGRGV